MEETIVVRGARQLLTLRGPTGPRRGPALRDLEIIPDGALLIRNGIIQQVGLSRRIENLAATRNAREISAVGRIVMPGFVDCHSGIVFPPFHFEADGSPVLSLNAVRATSAGRLKHRAASLLAGMARHGTTTLEAKSGFALDRTGELKSLRVAAGLHGKPLEIVSTYFGARAVPPEFHEDGERYLAWISSDVLPLVQRRELARFVQVSCEVFTLDQARRYLEFARGSGFAVKVHADQTLRTGATQLAVELEATAAEHLDCISAADVRYLAASSTIAVLTPGTSFYGGLGRHAPARSLIEAGAAVALASGFAPDQSPTYNMQTVIALACREMKMTPAEAICAATVNAAYAIGCGDSVGTLEQGRAADLILLNISDYRELPYYFGMNHVHMTMKRGVVIYGEDRAR